MTVPRASDPAIAAQVQRAVKEAARRNGTGAVSEQETVETAERLPTGVLKLEEVVPRPLQWGWQDRLVIGAFNLIEGDPDDGKSLITLDLAARFSTGRAMPDGSPNGFGRPVTVLLLCTEDDEETTVVPRLLAAGADLTHIRLLQTVLFLSVDREGKRHYAQIEPLWPGDADAIHREAEALGAEVVIIDPLLAYLDASVNPYSDQEIRAALRPTQVWAKRERVLVVAVRHLNKNSKEGNPKYRGSGSIGLLGLARSALLVASDPDQPPEEEGERRVLVPQKHNLSRRAPGLAYRVTTLWNPDLQRPIPYIEWLGESRHTARTLLQASRTPQDAEEAARKATALSQAVEAYREVLAPGPRKSVLVDKAVCALVSPSVAKQARVQVPVYTMRTRGFGPQGYWLSSLTPLETEEARLAAIAFDLQAEADERLGAPPVDEEA